MVPGTEEARPGHGDATSTVSGRGRDIVQARDVAGGIHFHGLTAPESLPRQLPADIPGFVHRTAELARIDAIAAGGPDSTSVPACLLDGAPGVGKTALAIRWARNARGRYPDGQLYINLRGYAPGGRLGPDQALGRFLEALGVPTAAIPVDADARAALYRSLLADRRVLIVLDNAATVTQVRPLLPGSDTCFVLVTSRNRLPGLVSRDGARRITLDVLSEPEAVDLLRAATAEYRGADPDADLAALSRLCGRLTLAMRIAAERAAARPHAPLAALNRDLRGGAAFLGEDMSGDEDQSDALYSVFAWSYEGLPRDAARMFRLLGLHPGADFSVMSAGAIAGVSRRQAERLIEVLADAHLLEQRMDGRWTFHDLLRAYAIELAGECESAAERADALESVCRWYLRVMNEAALLHDSLYGDEWGVAVPHEEPAEARPDGSVLAEVPDFSDHTAALAWFDAETDALTAVCRAAAAAGFHGIVWRLTALMRTPYLDRHPVDEWLPLGLIALQSAYAEGDGLGRAVAHIGLGVAYRQAHRVAEAIQAESDALVAARAVDDLRQETAALTLLGHAQRRGRRLDQACGSYRDALAAAERASLTQWIAWATIGLAGALFDAGRAQEARIALSRADGAAPSRFPGLHAERLRLLAAMEREAGDLVAADAYICEALDIAKVTDNAAFAGEFGIEYGRVLVAAGRGEEALAALTRTAELERRMGDRSGHAGALDVAGEACRQLGRFDEAIAAHTEAAAAHLSLEDAWRAAVALANLGQARVAAGQTGAPAAYHEALELLTPYQDPRAGELREKITGWLATAPQP